MGMHLRTLFWVFLFWSGLFIAYHQYSRLAASALLWQEQNHVRTFTEELSTMPTAFVGAMREDRLDLVAREQQGDLQGGVLVPPHKTNIIIFRADPHQGHD